MTKLRSSCRLIGISGSIVKRSRACASRTDPSASRRRRRAPEDESQVTGAFRQRVQLLIRLRRDLDFIDVRHRARRLDAIDAAEDAAARNRESSSPPRRGARAASRASARPARAAAAAPRSRCAAPRALEAQRLRAQPADRPRRHFEHVHALAVDAALGVHRTVMQPERLRRARHRRRDLRLDPGVHLRRRHVNRFLEERAVERIGLVEDRERPQRAVLEQALERELGAGNVLLDLDDVGFRIAQLASLPETPAGGGCDRTPTRSSAHRRRESRRGCPTTRSASTPRETRRAAGCDSGSTPIGTAKELGTGRPAALNFSRVRRLSRAATAASGGWPGQVRAVAPVARPSPSADRRRPARRRPDAARALSGRRRPIAILHGSEPGSR